MSWRRRHLLGGQGPPRLGQWLQRGYVRAIQTGTITIGSGSLTGSTAITAADLANSELVLLGYSTGALAASVREDNCRLDFVSSVLVRATHDTAGNDMVVSFAVVTYYPGYFQSVERGTVTITNGNAAATANLVTPVILARSRLAGLGYTFTAIAAQNNKARLSLSATQITATRAGTTDDVTLGWQVVQDN